MKNSITPILIVLLLSGCCSIQKKKNEAWKEWDKCRQAVEQECKDRGMSGYGECDFELHEKYRCWKEYQARTELIKWCSQ